MTTTTEIPLCTKSCGKVEKVQLTLVKEKCLGKMSALMQISAGKCGWGFVFILKCNICNGCIGWFCFIYKVFLPWNLDTELYSSNNYK